MSPELVVLVVWSCLRHTGTKFTKSSKKVRETKGKPFQGVRGKRGKMTCARSRRITWAMCTASTKGRKAVRSGPSQRQVRKGRAMGLGTGRKIRKGALPWNDFVQAVGDAAGTAQRGNPAGGTQNLRCGDPADLWPAKRQCVFVKADGVRCGCWPMRGARHCGKHGGYREVPAHPGTLRLYRSGAITAHDIEKRATHDLTAYSQQDRQAVKQAIRETSAQRRSPAPSLILAGIKALHTDDNGKSWRRWIETLKAEVKS